MFKGFLDGAVSKESACNLGGTGDLGSIPGLGRSPGGGKGNPLQYSCLKNPMDRGAWWPTAQRVTKSQNDYEGMQVVWLCPNGTNFREHSQYKQGPARTRKSPNSGHTTEHLCLGFVLPS